MMRSRSALAVALAVLALGACGGDGDARDTADPDAADTGDDGDSNDGDDDSNDGGDTGDASDTTSDDTPDTRDVVAAACNSDLDCRLTCAEGRCLDGQCVYAGPEPTATGCAIGPGDAPACVAAGAASPERVCFICNPLDDIGSYTARAFGEGFEVGAGRMLVEKLTPSSASWTISSARAASGGKSLYFGDPALGTYDVGERAAARAVTPPLTLPADGLALTLSFQLYADTERTPGFDFLRVLLVPAEGDGNDADAETVLWSSEAIGGSTLGEFLPIAVALADVRPGQRIAFEADSVDGIINGFEGFYLDDVTLRTSCCDAAHPCDDGNACTDDACDAGECRYTARASCCLSESDCDDGDACSDDRCDKAPGALGGACVSVVREDCCATAGDCDDEDPCTEDTCLLDASGTGASGGRCKMAPLCCTADEGCDDGDPCTIGACLGGQCRYRSACCREDADCDDGVACTLDRCDTGVCEYEFTYEAGCCIPDIMTEAFDGGGTPAGWTLSAPANNVGWRVHANNGAPSGTSVLYYGHPTLNFYESGGRNTGSATTPLVRLPDGVEMTLSFEVWLDVEDNPQRDLFRVEAVIGQTVVVLADKTGIAPRTWQEVAVDLTWAASQAVQIRFVFDTVDGAQNTTRGVLVDDVRLLSSCLSRRCGVDAECTSPASCIIGTCTEGVCRYGGGC